MNKKELRRMSIIGTHKGFTIYFDKDLDKFFAIKKDKEYSEYTYKNLKNRIENNEQLLIDENKRLWERINYKDKIIERNETVIQSLIIKLDDEDIMDMILELDYNSDKMRKLEEQLETKATASAIRKKNI